MEKIPMKNSAIDVIASKKAAQEKGVKSRTMLDLNSIHTGTANTYPGVLKARADKAKLDANVAAYKKKK